MGARLFVGNVNPQTSREELERLFSRVGNVHSIYLPADRSSGRPRGFAFVDLSDAATAQRALRELDGALLGGRRLRLKWAFEKRPRPSGGSFGPRADAVSARVDDSDADWGADDQDLYLDAGAAHPMARRKGGKHGSDRKRRQGTRRFID